MLRTLATLKPIVLVYKSCFYGRSALIRRVTSVFAILYRRLYQVILSLGVLLTLSACSEHTQIKDDLISLSDRLASFTGLDIPTSENTINLQAPSKQKLAHDIASMQINMRDFYAIGDCPLSQFIAQRNTALGKTHLPSTRFIYERQLLTTLSDCMAQLSADEALLSKMQGWYQQKADNLPLVWSNMLTQSDETYLAFTSAGDYIAGNESDGLQSTKFALRGLLDSLDAKYIDSGELEVYLRDLERTRLPARMFRTQKLLQQKLPPVTALLNEYLQRTSCKNQGDRDEVAIMRNIFTLFFAEKIQPLASRLNLYQYQLNPYFEQLAAHPHLPTELSLYLSQHYIDSANAYKQSMQDNIEAWQSIFALCEG